MRPFGETILKHKMLLEGLANKYHGKLIPVSTAVEVASRAMNFQTVYDFESCLAVMQEAFNVNDGYFVDSADVAPVRHGIWLPIVSYNNTYKCSECGRLLVDITDGLKMVAKHYPYCHCGAKMDRG